MGRKAWGIEQPRKASLWLVVLILGVLSLSCLEAPSPAPATLAPPATTAPATLPPTRTPEPADTGWQWMAQGVEARVIHLTVGLNTERITIARLDPAHVQFRVHYTPGQASPVSVWAAQTGALLTINAGYFTAENRVTGRTITHGEPHGVILGDYAGMFAVTESGEVGVRWLRAQPYDPAEALREAVMSFPVLVKPGGIMGFPADADDGRSSRRTVIAQDTAGRILMMIAPRGYLSLHALSVWLAESDLELDIALNLDGGTSSGFWMQQGAQIDSLIPVPSVITVLPR